MADLIIDFIATVTDLFWWDGSMTWAETWQQYRQLGRESHLRGNKR